MTCIIIDDEPLASELLKSYCEKIDDVLVLGVFNNPLLALPLIQEKKPELILLDIQMPELTGVQLAKIINPSSKIIFTTAYSEYAVDGFELNAVDYLVKPISFERFIIALNKVKNRNNPSTADFQQTSKDYIFVKTEYRHQKIDYSDILYIKGLGDYVAVVTRKEKILTLENMKEFEKILPNDKFKRVHKSYIVATDKIEYVERNRIKIEKEFIPISASYQKEFAEWMKNR